MDTELHFDWYLLFIFLGFFQGLFLGILIFIRGARSGPRFHYLGIFILSLALILAEVVLDYSGYMIRMIRFDKFSFPAQFLLAPSIYLFIYLSLYKKRLRKAWVHYIPFFLVLLCFFFYYIQDSAFKTGLRSGNINEDRTGHALFSLFTYFHFLVFAHLGLYGILMWRIINKKYRETSTRIFNRKKSYMNQYRNLFFYYVLALVIMLTLLVKYHPFGDFLFAVYLTCIIYIITINITFRSVNNYYQNKQAVRYASSTLGDDDKQSILGRIREVVENEEFFCRDNATIEEVSRRIKVSKHNVSQVINELLEISYFEYLARCRINKAKTLLSDPKYHNITIDEISFMVGYNSRSAFNRVFKSMVGTTPAEFRRQS